MSKQTLVFNDIEVNKKYFYASKQAIPLNLVKIELNKIMTLINILLIICMSFKIEEESVYLKYTEIWNKIKSIKFHSQPIYDEHSIIQLIHCFQEMKSLKKKFIMFVFQQSVLIQY